MSATFETLTTTYENITPEIAKEYLGRNSKNRVVKPKSVEAYARDMQHGDFKTIHQGIAFDTEGNLIDGQHRLLAIILSNTPVTMMVTRGVPVDDGIIATDRGVSRSVRDVMAIENKNCAPTSDSRVLSNPKIISAINQLVSMGYKKEKVTVSENKRIFENFKSSITNIFDNIVSRLGSCGRAQMLAAAIAAAECGVDIDSITKFFNIFYKDDVGGCFDYNIQAALNWKRQIDDAKIHKVQIDRKKLYLGTQNAIYHFVNNTGVSRIVAPAEPRYDIREKTEHALCVS